MNTSDGVASVGRRTSREIDNWESRGKGMRKDEI
jgi:hypothetical protein